MHPPYQLSCLFSLGLDVSKVFRKIGCLTRQLHLYHQVALEVVMLRTSTLEVLTAAATTMIEGVMTFPSHSHTILRSFVHITYYTMWQSSKCENGFKHWRHLVSGQTMILFIGLIHYQAIKMKHPRLNLVNFHFVKNSRSIFQILNSTQVRFSEQPS